MSRPAFLDHTKDPETVALVILNTPISKSSISLFQSVWNSSCLRVCADGGANRLYNLFESNDRMKYLPDLIVGDLDSLEEHVREFYEEQLVPVIRKDDEYSTDLSKAFNELWSFSPKNSKIDQTMIFGGTSGRLDQTIHTLVFLHHQLIDRPNQKVWVISENCVSCVLESGVTTVFDVSSKYLGPTCGILPVGVDSAYVTTTGLRWNLVEQPTSFKGLVSTSNRMVDNIVTIHTSAPIIWTCELSLNTS